MKVHGTLIGRLRDARLLKVVVETTRGMSR
jgi:hypothetical protein